MKTFLGLKKLHPELTTKDVLVVLNPDGSSDVTWIKEGYQTPPDDIWESASSIAEEEFKVETNRANAYPYIGDQLDALWKGGAAAEEMRERIMAVKAKYPKLNK